MCSKKQLIDLANTAFDLKAVVNDLPDTIVWNKKKTKRQSCPDFGTIFIGLDKVTDPVALSEIEDAAVGDGPVFTAPETWSWGNIAKAIGAFPSATAARKNGWDGFPEDGFTFRQVRVNKVRGEILVVHIKDENNPWVADFLPSTTSSST